MPALEKVPIAHAHSVNKRHPIHCNLNRTLENNGMLTQYMSRLMRLLPSPIFDEFLMPSDHARYP